MKATNKEISEQFSAGNLSACYDYLADNVEWKIVGNETSKGTENVMASCNKMLVEMQGATFKNTNTISENSSIVIEGVCSYKGPGGKSGEVAYCDVFSFDGDKILSITSYCVEQKV